LGPAGCGLSWRYSSKVCSHGSPEQAQDVPALDAEALDRAKELGINVSAVAEAALIEAVVVLMAGV